MFDQRQHRMLDAMGIQLWLPRSQQRQADTFATTASTSESLSTGEHLHDWDSLSVAVASCQRCELSKSRSQAVFGSGDQHAQLMIIGTPPDENEDRHGEPFVGAAGQLLEQMLFACGLRRDQVYLTNVIKCRPLAGANPSNQELLSCRHYLNRQIELVAPKLLLLMGVVAATSLLDIDQPVGQMRGQIYHYGELQVPLMVTYDLAYLLRQPSEKHNSWQDLQSVIQRLGGDN